MTILQSNVLPTYSKIDVIVTGGGLTAIFAALALAKTGYKVLLVGKSAPSMPSRSVVLLESSLKYLDWLGALEKIIQLSEKIVSLRMIDDTHQLLPVPPVILTASEIGSTALGVNILNDDLIGILRNLANAQSNIYSVNGDITEYEFSRTDATVILNDGTRLSGQFIVAADGHNSRALSAASIGFRTWTYPQVALTLILSHERPHRNIMTEYYTRSGPFTLLPMTKQNDAPNRSSLVWVMKVEEAQRRLTAPLNELEFEIECYSKSEFGAMQIESVIGQFPLRAKKVSHYSRFRLGLVGESCHVFPPIHAQGLNLSLRDVANLVDCLAGIDLENSAELHRNMVRYDKNRRFDVGLRLLGVDILNRSLLANYFPVDLLRGASMHALASSGSLRRAIIREAILPHSDNKRMMRQ